MAAVWLQMAALLFAVATVGRGIKMKVEESAQFVSIKVDLVQAEAMMDRAVNGTSFWKDEVKALRVPSAKWQDVMAKNTNQALQDLREDFWSYLEAVNMIGDAGEHERIKRSTWLGRAIGELAGHWEGTPTPSEYSKLLQVIQHIQAASRDEQKAIDGVLTSQMDLIKADRMVQAKIVANDNMVTALSKATQDKLNAVDDKFSVLAKGNVISSLAWVAVEEVRSYLNTLKFALESAVEHRLSPLVVSRDVLRRALEGLEIPKGLELPASTKGDLGFYYRNPLTSMRAGNGTLIFDVKVPLVRVGVEHWLQPTATWEKMHELQFSELAISENTFRYLTRRDVRSCIADKVEGLLICMKRKIEIKKEFRGSIVVHDLTLEKLFVSLPRPMKAMVRCTTSKDSMAHTVVLNKTNEIKLAMSCTLFTELFEIFRMDQYPVIPKRNFQAEVTHLEGTYTNATEVLATHDAQIDLMHEVLLMVSRNETWMETRNSTRWRKIVQLLERSKTENQVGSLENTLAGIEADKADTSFAALVAQIAGSMSIWEWGMSILSFFVLVSLVAVIWKMCFCASNRARATWESSESRRWLRRMAKLETKAMDSIEAIEMKEAKRGENDKCKDRANKMVRKMRDFELQLKGLTDDLGHMNRWMEMLQDTLPRLAALESAIDRRSMGSSRPAGSDDDQDSY